MNLQPGYRFFGFPDLRFDRPCRSGFFFQFQFGQCKCRLFRFDLQLFPGIPAFCKYRLRGGQRGSGQKSCHAFVICHLSIFRLRTLLRSAAAFSLFRVLALSLWSTAAFSLLRVRPLSLLPSLRIVLRLIRLLPFAPARPEDFYTVPAEAKSFCAETGVDALAIAFGTAHGFYKSQPKLDFGVVRDCAAATGLPLVMHGGSGVSPDGFRQAIAAGIRKINYYSYMSKAGYEAAAQCIASGRTKYHHDVEYAAYEAMKEDVKKAIRVFSGE